MTLTAVPVPSRFLTGTVFAPVDDELDVADLPVTGRLPEQLHGAYLRNGSNPQFAPLGAYHWFDGDGMVHGVYLDGGRARYRNRWVETPGLLHERAAGHALFGGLANIIVPPEEILAECGMFKNAANTNVIRHAGKVLALWEGGKPTELTWELDTVGQWDYAGKLVGAMTAHPKWDDRSGELIFIGYSGSQRPFLRHHVVDCAGTLVRSVDIDIPRSVMMHDFLTTEHYSLFFDMPAVIEPAAMMAGEKMWQPDLGCRIGVLPRHATSDTTRWFEIDPMYVFHFLNAWEEPGTDRIVAIGCRMPSVDLDFDAADAGDARSRQGIGLHRWVIDLDAGTVREEQMSDTMSDFPRVNDALVGYASRYGHVSTKVGSNRESVFDAVARFDIVTGASTVKHFGDNASLGEAVFAADPDGRDERDGWVLVYVTDVTSGDTDLVVLDGHDITEEVARVHMPRRVPIGFHGNWLPTS